MVVVTCVITVISMSPSMRREWIEISNEHDLHQTANSLPPCGGSGLKCFSPVKINAFRNCLPPCGGSGLKYSGS